VKQILSLEGKEQKKGGGKSKERVAYLEIQHLEADGWKKENGPH